MTSIYLAGKIHKDDWRQDTVTGIREAWGDYDYSAPAWSANDPHWPVLRLGVLGTFDYTGPYFVETCTHGGCEQDEHRASSQCDADPADRHGTRNRCLGAINRSDIVFAWLDDLTAYGTLAEIGYAKGLGKKIIVASPELPRTAVALSYDAMEGREHHGIGMEHLWFAFSLADTVIQAGTPDEALKELAEYYVKLDSPIEEAFWRAFLEAKPQELSGLKAQHSVFDGRYRIDFALPDQKVGIELDGHAYHSDPKTFTEDRVRQRELEFDGWRIIRFSGSEVNKDPGECVRQAAQLAARFQQDTTP
jgi:very-short-patch-repair endonuclease